MSSVSRGGEPAWRSNTYRRALFQPEPRQDMVLQAVADCGPSSLLKTWHWSFWIRCSWLWCVWKPECWDPIPSSRFPLGTPSFSPGAVCDRTSKSRASTSNHIWCWGKDCPDILCEKCPEYNPQQQVASSPFHERVMAGGILKLIQVPIMPCMSCLSSWHLGRKCWDEIISQEMVRRSMVIWLFLFVRCCSFLFFAR